MDKSGFLSEMAKIESAQNACNSDNRSSKRTQEICRAVDIAIQELSDAVNDVSGWVQWYFETLKTSKYDGSCRCSAVDVWDRVQ